MQFSTEMIPAVLLTAAVYLFAAAGLWKYELKKVYGRRTRREKVLTVGVLVLFVLLQLLIAAREGEPSWADGTLSAQVYRMLLWVFNGNVQLLSFAVCLVCGIPAMVVGTAVLDELAQKKTMLELPFYFYLLFFMVEELFYRPLLVPVTAWFALLLLTGVLYGLIKNRQEGTTKTKTILLAVMAVSALALLAAEWHQMVLPLVWYAGMFVLNAGAAVLLNRTGVLKKKIWCAVILVCYIILFLIGRIF